MKDNGVYQLETGDDGEVPVVLEHNGAYDNEGASEWLEIRSYIGSKQSKTRIQGWENPGGEVESYIHDAETVRELADYLYEVAKQMEQNPAEMSEEEYQEHRDE